MARVGRWSWLAALIVAAGCASPETTANAPARTESRLPRTYSVEDFYKNTALRGASW